MLKFVCRAIGFLCLACALVAGVLDVILSIDASRLVLTPIGQTWYKLDFESLNLTQSIIEHYLHPFIWNPIMQWVLRQPTIIVFFVLALIFYALGHKRPSPYDRYRV
jgi:hypothetical protein